MQSVMPSQEDIYLFHEGTLYESWKMMGSHILDAEGTEGVRFVVWAPHAKEAAVVGDFNSWDGTGHKMDRISGGLWMLFIPGLTEGELYKYELITEQNERILKADPYAFFAEKKPDTASVVYGLEGYDWQDRNWIKERKQKPVYEKPVLIYEVHPGTWKKTPEGTHYTYRELADELIPYVKELGYTHIEMLPIAEHPFDGSWGYQLTGYFAVTSRYGTPKDFMYFVDRCHQEAIGVILDWVPAHFCKDAHGLGRFDGTPLYEPADERRGERANWGTYNFDYSKPEVRSFLISNALFWMEMFHIDGMRVDAVSYMIYLNHGSDAQLMLKNEFGGDENLEAIAFLKQLNKAVFGRFPYTLMAAEEATDWKGVTSPVHEGGLGFNYKWNMGWMNDILHYMDYHPDHRSEIHNQLTFSFSYTYTENYILPFSHDEVVHGKKSLLDKMPGDYWQKFANLRLLFSYMMAHPGKKLLFMGGELAQFAEWKDKEQLDWHLLDYDYHYKFHRFVRSLNHFYTGASSIWRLDHEPDGLQWINADDAEKSVLSFIRKGKRKGDYTIHLFNFSANVHEDYRIGVPSRGSYTEVFNSDLEEYGGSGLHNPTIPTMKAEYRDFSYSIAIKLPPLAAVVLKKQPSRPKPHKQKPKTTRKG
ncbi:1,4-alpha-glucan branching protein GlgB [Bacillus marinisedimentorum]|uniref:1,4-alpha-glucan branching protein GlgB n=1 Tax=Bacillus marinisedimentorum TaxID=1821260 RepID=UPI0007E06D2D|nr:1,4-alpha-glucan branching protein GlgB [Bacillus marinisedimentorum]